MYDGTSPDGMMLCSMCHDGMHGNYTQYIIRDTWIMACCDQYVAYGMPRISQGMVYDAVPCAMQSRVA